jgi:hypothetical protein
MKAIIDKGKGQLILVKLETNPESALELCALVKKTWGERCFRRVEILRLSGGWQLFPDLYERTAAALRRDIALTWGNAMTLIRLGRLYIRNAIKNLPLIPKLPDISSIDFSADPVLVLGAGPSMDLVLDELFKFPVAGQREKRPFRIICADTCVTSLLERNIQPDLVVILESQHWNLRDFSGARFWDVPAAVDLSSLPASTRVLGGKTFIFMTPWTELRLFDRLEQAELLPSRLTPLGSVGLSAVELALQLSSGSIVASGMDFSYTIDAYHARSSPGHQARLAVKTRLNSLFNAEAAFREGTFAAVSKAGSPVRSDPVMKKYRGLFEEEFSFSERIFEIIGPGLPLGVKQLSLKEAVDILFGNNNKKKNSESSISSSPSANSQAILRETQWLNNKMKRYTEKIELLKNFIQKEKNDLIKLRDILTGKTTANLEEKENLLETLDYLWAHFPECAAAGGRRPKVADLSFLKRIRAEIDPFLKLWDKAFIMNNE